ncbi:MAG: hypothetical protein M0P74_09275 [Syntrophales bacterium]|jgi:DNA-binding protein Fis|nr:hypothetical protein [Syntrophales bacterium]
MVRAAKRNGNGLTPRSTQTTPKDVAEKILEKNLDDITAILCQPGINKSRIYDEVMEMVDRSLLRISLRRTNQVKSAAASYLGINRNTLQKKLIKLQLGDEGE